MAVCTRHVSLPIAGMEVTGGHTLNYLHSPYASYLSSYDDVTERGERVFFPLPLSGRRSMPLLPRRPGMDVRAWIERIVFVQRVSDDSAFFVIIFWTVVGEPV